MVSQIDMPISVGAVFEPPDRVRPVWFMWQGRRYAVTQVTYTWGRREGACRVQDFSVTAGDNLYQISFYRDAMSWRLMAVDDGG